MQQHWENLQGFLFGQKYKTNDPLDYAEIPLDRDSGYIQKLLDRSKWIKLQKHTDASVDPDILEACIKTKAKVVTEINEKPYVKHDHKVWCSRVTDVGHNKWPVSKECEHIKTQIEAAMKSIDFECGLDSSIEYVNYSSMHLVNKQYCKIYANHRTNKWDSGHQAAGGLSYPDR